MKKKTKTLISIVLLLLVIGAGILTSLTAQNKKPLVNMSKINHLAGGAEVQEAVNLDELQKGIESKKKERQAAEAAAIAAAEAKAAEEEASQAKGDILIVLDPGHQGSHVDMSAPEPNAPGSGEMKAKCTSGTSGQYSGLPEYQLTLDISQALRQELEAMGYQVLLTREDNDTAISNAERAQLANNAGADAYIRIHANGSENAGANGALALVPSPGNAYVGELHGQSYALSEKVLSAYCAETGFANQGIQENDTMTGINWSQVPVMILEMGFMSNEHDDLAMADDGFQEVMVKGIANGIDDYFSAP